MRVANFLFPLTLLSSALLPSALFCEKPISRFGLDRKMSPHTAGNDLIFLYRGISSAQTRYLGPNKSFWLRLAETLAVYYPLANWSATVQHEIFGHGWRARSLGKDVAEVKSYQIYTPFPYSKYTKAGKTSGWASLDITTDQRLAINIGGLESEIVLARKLKKGWIGSRHVEKRLSWLYYSTAFSFTNYALSLGKTNGLGHDVANYITRLNELYPSRPINHRYVKWHSVLNLLDPMLWFAAFENFYYITTGKDLAVPMFQTKGVKWLPSYRTDLTPFGLENRFETYFLIDDKLLYLYGNFAKRGSTSAFGLGFDRHALFKFRKTSFDVECDIWNQPKMALDLGTERSGKSLWGVRALLTMNVNFGSLIWYEQFGFKTKGYYAGESLKAALIGRLGIAARF